MRIAAKASRWRFTTGAWVSGLLAGILGRRAEHPSARAGPSVGTLDDPRIYGIVLTQADLDALVWAPIPGNCDGDDDVDLGDYVDFEACLHGPGGGLGDGCECFDFDTDGDVDLEDFATFQVNFAG